MPRFLHLAASATLFSFASFASFASFGCAGRAAVPHDESSVASAFRPHPHVLAAAATEEGGSAVAEPELKPLPPSKTRPKSTTQRTIGWFSLGAGVLSGGIAATTGVMMLHQADERRSGCSAAKVCSSDGFNANAQIAALSPWNIGSAVVAAAGIGLGAVLLLTQPRDDGKDTALVVSPASSGATVSLWRAF
jgi:hypothetical protein